MYNTIFFTVNFKISEIEIKYQCRIIKKHFCKMFRFRFISRIKSNISKDHGIVLQGGRVYQGFARQI